MADEKDSHLDPSKSHDDEAPPEDGATSRPEPHDPDPETRMLDQIAALHEDESTPPAADQSEEDASDEQPVASEPTTDQEPTEVLGADNASGAEPVSATANPNEPGLTQEPVEARTERTAMLSPIAAAGGNDAPPGSTAVPATQQPSKKRRWPWIVALVVLLLGAGYVGLAYATQDTLPATLTVEDVDVSGMSVEEAAPVLEDAFAERAEREITINVADAEDASATIVPAQAGYSYDVDATLDELTDLTFHPGALWSRLFGEAHVSAETQVDEATASEAVAGLEEQLSFEPTEGSVVYAGAELDYTEPIDGFTVNSEELAAQLDEVWLSETQELTAPGEVADPAVSADQWEQFVTEVAQPLVDGDYTVTAGDISTQLTPAQLGSAAEVLVEEPSEATAETDEAETAETEDTTDGAQPVLVLDDEQLTDALAQNNSEFASTNQDATVELTGSPGSGQPEVVPGSVGRGVDGEQVVDEILADLNGEQSRTITVELQEIEPEITTEDAEAWDVNHVQAEYATPYPPEDGPRTANLRVGADRINGTVIMPGEEFNLNSLLAPVTEANGYYQSGVVESGVTTTAVGGGLSQIATMAYNAGFLGGMDIVEHKPHSRWFDRYPQGRESTYWEGQINVRWANDTDAPVIVEMWLADNQVHTRLWGSDYYDGETSTSDPYNHTASPTIRSSDDECIPERGGREGFTVDVHRTKTPPGGDPIRESWSWAYSGWPTVICE